MVHSTQACMHWLQKLMQPLKQAVSYIAINVNEHQLIDCAQLNLRTIQPEN